MNDDKDSTSNLREVALVFAKLGATTFGGPAAHVAIMEEQLVRHRKWLTHEEFMDLLAVSNVIPGPNSTELAMHIGHRRAGWLGLWIAGLCFILPAAVLVTLLAWAYVQYAQLPEFKGILFGVKPVVVAIVFQALWILGKAVLKTRTTWILAVFVSISALADIAELIVLFGTGTVLGFAKLLTTKEEQRLKPVLWLITLACIALALSFYGGTHENGAKPFDLNTLFWFFTKVGSVLYGSGYVLLAFLQADLVEQLHWLSPAQLLDAVAIGQITPGPVFTTATFIGYILGGLPGALLSTVGIFLPAFIFVSLSALFVNRLRESPVASAFLDGLNIASLALMVAVTYDLAQDALNTIPGITIAILSAIALIKFRVNSTYLLIAGALLGVLATWFDVI